MSLHLSHMTASRVTGNLKQEFKDLFEQSIRLKIHSGSQIFQDVQDNKLRCRLFTNAGKIQAAVAWTRELGEVKCNDTSIQAYQIAFVYPDDLSLTGDLFGYVAKSCQDVAKEKLPSNSAGVSTALSFPLKNPNPKLAGQLLASGFKVAQRGASSEDPTVFLLKDSGAIVRMFEERSKEPRPAQDSGLKAEKVVSTQTKETPRKPVPIFAPGSALGARPIEGAAASSAEVGRKKVVTAQFGVYSPEARYKSVTLMQKYVALIASGKKTVEGRINTGMFKNVRAGDKFRFFDRNNEKNEVFCTVRGVEIFKTFKEMLSCYGTEACVPGERSLESAVILYNRIPGYSDKAARFGVLGLELQVDRKDSKSCREETRFENKEGSSGSHKREHQGDHEDSRKRT